MGCSHRKLSETGLRIVGTFLKVKLCGCVRQSADIGTSVLDDNRISLGSITLAPLAEVLADHVWVTWINTQ